MAEQLTTEEFQKRYGTSSNQISVEEWKSKYETKPPALPEEKSFRGFLKNIPGSAAGLVEPLLHPIDTATAIGKTALGAVESAVPEKYRQMDPSNRQHFDMLLEGLKQRYGGLEQIKETAYKDPVGFIADISAVLTGGGSAAAKLPGTIGKIAATTAKAGRAIDPIADAMALGKKAAGVTGKYGSEILGITTGRGGETVRQAFKGTEEFVEKMRGQGGIEDVVNDMKSALQNIRNERSQQYRAKLVQISQDQRQLDLTPVYTELKTRLKDFNIKVIPAPGGEGYPQLDFSRSTIGNKADQLKVKREFETLLEWGTKPNDLTPLGVDTLKRRLDDFYSDSSQARSLVESVNNKVRKVLDTVPGYHEMVKGYADASEMIKKMESELSIGKGKNPGIAVRKIINVFNQTNEYRKTLLEALDKYSNKKLEQQVAGVGMSSITPTGIMRPLTGAGMMVGAATGQINPLALLTVLGASPRFVGEGAVLAGKAAKGLGKVSRTPFATAPVYRPAGLTTTMEEDIEKRFDYDPETRQLVPRK